MSFGARQYDPQLGRFLSVDPMASADGQDMLSPYHAMGNNPVSMVDPGGLSDHLSDAKLMSFNPNIGLPSVTNGHYTPAINTEGWAWLGKWIPCSAHGAAEGLRAAYGDGVASSYEETTGSSSGNDDNNSSSVAGNYESGTTGTGQGGGGTIPTMTLPDGETVAIEGSFDHTADMNPNDVSLPEVTIAGSSGAVSWMLPGLDIIQPGAPYAYPPNGGAATPPITGEIAKDFILTRIGVTRANSEYFSPRGTTISQRNLLENTNTDIYNEWRVVKPFNVEQSQIADPNGLPTGGIQLKSSIPAGGLIDGGYIEPIDPVDFPDIIIF